MSDELLRFSFMSHGPMLDEDGAFVLAADAEAHEKAAVERAIRDCIAAVEDLPLVDQHGNLTGVEFKSSVTATLRALLEKPIQEDGN